MNREIKFRGKSIKSGEWLHGDYIRNRGKHFIAPPGIADPTKTWEDFETDPDTIGQYTGLTDKNGREIYEGDIVNDKGHLRVVVFEDSMWCVQNNIVEPEDNPQRWFVVTAGYVVVGNIHDCDDELKATLTNKTL